MTIHIAFNIYLIIGLCCFPAGVITLIVGMSLWGHELGAYLLYMTIPLWILGAALTMYGLGRGSH